MDTIHIFGEPVVLCKNRVRYDLAFKGFVSVPFLHEDMRIKLLREAERMGYHQLPMSLSNGKVTQEIWQAEKLPESELFTRFFAVVKQHLGEYFTYLAIECMRTPLNFNDCHLHRYEIGGGISPHVDGRRYVNLVVLVVLEGYGDLYVCNDREKTNSRRVPCIPGHLIMFPARDFMEWTNTPFHYLTNVRSRRYLVSLRQDTRKRAS